MDDCEDSMLDIARLRYGQAVKCYDEGFGSIRVDVYPDFSSLLLMEPDTLMC